MSAQPGSRLGPGAAILGGVLLFVGTYLHPMGADPNVPLAAFTEYAADRLWVFSHLTQLLGVVLMVAALVLLSRRMADGPAAEWVILGMVGAVASLAVAGALQAVDGVALKFMVDRWAAAAEPEKAALFQATFGVRQIEVGLASIGSLLFALTLSLYGVALLIDRRLPGWFAALAILAGVPTAVAGVVIARTGFSESTMDINMPSGSLAIVWMILLGILGWRHSTF